MEPQGDEKTVQNDQQQLLQAISLLNPQLRRNLYQAVTTDSYTLETFLNDEHKTEAVDDYVTDLEKRCELVRRFQDLAKRCADKGEPYPPQLNATALAVIMVANVSELEDTLANERLAEETLRALCIDSVEGLRTYLSKGTGITGCSTPNPAVQAPSDTISAVIASLARSPERNMPQDQMGSPTRTHTLKRKRQHGSEAGSPNPSSGASSPKKRRSVTATQKAKERDNRACIVAGTTDPEAAHIFPFSAGNSDRMQLSLMLRRFWGQDDFKRWSDKFHDSGVTESPKNLISLSHQIHFWWDKAKFGFKPLRKVKNGVVLQFHWFRQPLLKPKEIIGEDFLQQAFEGNTKIWGERLAHRKSGYPVKTGQVFTITAEREEDVPDWELLELQWNLLRVAAMSGAANVPDSYYLESDDESEGGLGVWGQEEEEEEEVSCWEDEDGYLDNGEASH